MVILIIYLMVVAGFTFLSPTSPLFHLHIIRVIAFMTVFMCPSTLSKINFTALKVHYKVYTHTPSY